MLGLRQTLQLSFKVANELRLNPLSSYHKQCLQRLYKFTINGNEISRRFSLEAKTAIDECKSDNDKMTKQPIGKLERRLMIEFTCKKCDTRNSKTMSKLAYEKGVVLIRCDGCKNNHLIADNLGWFGSDQKKRNIEKLMSLNGESVKRLSQYNNELFEVVKKEEPIGEVSNKDEN